MQQYCKGLLAVRIYRSTRTPAILELLAVSQGRGRGDFSININEKIYATRSLRPATVSFRWSTCFLAANHSIL